MSQPIAYPKFRATDSTTGLALVGGKVYTYIAGTSTPKATYTDSTLVTPNTNPTILDARGEADIWPNGSYKVILKDSLDNTIWTVDNITDFTTFTGNLSITGNITASGNLTIGGNTALGDAQGDTLSISGSVIKNSSGNYTFPAPSSGTLMTFQGITTADSFIPAAATVPTNGMYLPGANTVGFASNSTVRLSYNGTGNFTYSAPSAGDTININQIAGANALITSLALSGGNTKWTLTNTSNTANSQTVFVMSVGGSSAGDAYHQLTIGGATDWTYGVDNSDSDAFVWSQNAALGTSNALRISTTGNVAAVGTAGTIGYGTGAGGSVAQATSKATAVTLNKGSGQITLNNANLAANTTVSFTLNNSLIAATDNAILNHSSIGNGTDYNIWASTFASGSCQINVRNITAGALAEAIVINFSLIKGVTS